MMILHSLNNDPLRFSRCRISALASLATFWLFSYPAFATFPAILPLSSLDGTTGIRIDGPLASGFLGTSVSKAGDLNGDGIGDFVLGAPDSALNTGATYVVFGTPGGLPNLYDLSLLNGTTGFLVIGVPNSQLGSSAAPLDLNGDHIDDLVLGAPGESAVYVIYGKTSGFPSSVDLGAPPADFGISRLQGPALGQTGYAVASAGDLNGDGFADLAIGNGSPNVGTGYLVFGKSGGPGSLDLTNLAASGAQGFAIDSAGVNATRFAVAPAGDVNGDGLADLIIGSPDAAKSYVLFGSTTPFTAQVSLLNMTDGTHGFQLSGPASSWFGSSVSTAGDVNADGLADLIIGAQMASNVSIIQAGKVYVVFGRSAFPGTLDATVLDGSNGGFQLSSAVRGERAGWAVAPAGDINADGIADILIGAPYGSYNARASGNTYVVFGKSGAAQNVSLSGGLDGSNGFQIVGVVAGDLSGFSVSSAGDVNGDGGDDIVIGARNASPNGLPNAGSAFVVHGQVSTPADTTPPTITGTRTPAGNVSGWNNTDVTVSFICSDGQSGIKSCEPDRVVTTEGVNLSVTGTAVDLAGNTASTTVGSISIDKTPPQVSVTGVTAGALYYGNAPAAGCGTQDVLSGVARPATLNIIAGPTVKGVTSYTATCGGGMDQAGNAGSASVAYRVKIRR